MSGDEVIVMVAGVVLGPAALVWRLFKLSQIDTMGRSRRGTLVWLSLVVVGCATGIVVVLLTAASHDVRDSEPYVFLYLMLGLAWLRLCDVAFAYAGVSVRDDVIERRNEAARLAVTGALIGAACCYAGGNIGDGPGWWVVIACAVLATGSYLAAWIGFDRLTGVNDAVTIDRDPASGVRLGGYLAASGLIFGRGVAGDWSWMYETIADLIQVAWVVLPLVAAAVLVERWARPTIERPRPPIVAAGVLPALAYVGAAIVYVLSLGWPE